MKAGLVAGWGAVRLFLTRVLVDPVREGRLRDTGWPAGLRPIVAVALVSYVVAIGLILLAGVLRAQLGLATQAGPGTPTFPRAVLWIVFTLTAIAIALGQSGALHSRAWARWIVTAFSVLVLLLASTPDQAAVPWGRIVAVIASISLVVFVALRGHRQFAWWEFAVILGLVAGSFATSVAAVGAASRPFGYDFGPVVVSLVLLTVGQLAVPAAIAAGASVTELAVSSALWAVGAVRDRLGMPVLIALVVIVLAWRSYDIVVLVQSSGLDGQLGGIIAGLLFLAAVALLWWLIARLRPTGEAPTTTGLISTLAGVALLVAAFLTPTIPSAFAQLGGLVIISFGGPVDLIGDVLLAISSVTDTSIAINAVRTLTGIALVILAIALARRGRAVLPELLAAIGLANALSAGNNLLDLPYDWTPDTLSLVATALVLVGLAWVLIRRRATLNRLAALAAALLMAALFAHREFISDPVAAVLGSAAAATVLVGFIWGFLTGYGRANDGSPQYPQPARVQLVLANALFGATVLAYGVLARDPNSVINLGQFTSAGAQGFGDALIAGSLLVALRAAVTDRELE